MSKVTEAIEILTALGLPKGQQNERSGLTLLALLDVREDTPWSESKQRMIRIHDMMVFIKENYGREYAENSRETFRRQTLHQFIQAAITAINPDDLTRRTNSPNTVYTVTDEVLEVIRKFRTSNWLSALEQFIKDKGKLIEKYEKRHARHLVPLDLPDGTHIKLSPGKHNELQVRLVEKFRVRFCPQSEVLYIGDTARKMLHVKRDILEKLNIPITEHDKLPDIVLYDSSKNHLILIEAVTAHGPLSPKRHTELEEVLKECPAKRIYVSAFLDFREFKRHIDNIAWETEVWIESNPDHMIHFNGPKFFTVYD